MAPPCCEASSKVRTSESASSQHLWMRIDAESSRISSPTIPVGETLKHVRCLPPCGVTSRELLSGVGGN